MVVAGKRGTGTSVPVSHFDHMVAVDAAHRIEVAELQTRIERLTAILREHGIPLPIDDPRLGASDGEHLRQCRDVVTTAYALMEQITAFEDALTDLRRMVGSGVEMLGDTWR